MSEERRYKGRVKEVQVKGGARKYKRIREERGERGSSVIINSKTEKKTRGRQQCSLLAVLQSLIRCHVRLRHCRWKDDIIFYTKQTCGLILYNENK